MHSKTSPVDSSQVALMESSAERITRLGFLLTAMITATKLPTPRTLKVGTKVSLGARQDKTRRHEAVLKVTTRQAKYTSSRPQ